MGDVVSRMIEKTRAPTSSNRDIQMALSGCHDTTLAAVLSSSPRTPATSLLNCLKIAQSPQLPNLRSLLVAGGARSFLQRAY